ncbi:hypothetical protein [Curvibacter microcysteis]|uniref:hypothetical protein n=1 Tax=Curvibacter microcysteis TaxID=3026419 RepID=UPI0039065F63
MHGFGTTREDYADIVRKVEFVGHHFLAFEVPGCGDTPCADLSTVNIPFQVKAALIMFGRMGFRRFGLH